MLQKRSGVVNLYFFNLVDMVLICEMVRLQGCPFVISYVFI